MNIHTQNALNDTLKPEHYTWRKVTTRVNNLMGGKLWIDHYGDMIIKNHTTFQECILKFIPESKGWFNFGAPSSQSTSTQSALHQETNLGQITGVLNDSTGTPVWRIHGSWSTSLHAYRIESKNKDCPAWLSTPLLLWKKSTNELNQFNFTTFTAALNEINSSLQQLLPKSDSRFRKDQRALEKGDWSGADRSKEEIEDFQRSMRRECIDKFILDGTANGSIQGKKSENEIECGEEWWKSRWFYRMIDEDSGNAHWVFDDNYWKIRESVIEGGSWPEFVPKLFD